MKSMKAVVIVFAIAIATYSDAQAADSAARLAADVGVNVNATYLPVFSYTPGASLNINFVAHLSYIASANTIGMQVRVMSADTGYAGNCAFTTYGVSGTAASATVNEIDIIAIGTNPADTAAAAACAATPCAIDISCNLTSDASPGAIVVEAQLETGTTSAPIKAGASYYLVVTN